MSGLLNKHALLAAAKAPLPIERVELPEIQGHVFVRGMSGTERDGWEKSLIVGRGKRRAVDTTNVRARLAVATVCDASGVRLFSDSDADPLGGLPAAVLNRIFEVAQRLSGVSDEDVDELGKSSAPEGGSDSPSN